MSYIKGYSNWALPFFKGEVSIGGGVDLSIWMFNVRSILISILIFALVSCNSESAPNCFQNAGNLSRDEIVVQDFTKITVFENVSLVLKQGPETIVEVEAGEFLRDEISVEVEGDRLILRDTNDCNYFREYGTTTIYVTTPNITEIRSSTGNTIRSEGVLLYPTLTLLSESFINPESETTDGEFDLDVATASLNVVVNGIAYFKLRGTTENLSLNIAAGDSRIEAENLVAENVTIDHRGTNDIFINPQETLSGVIRGTGDVVSYNRPAVVDVEVLFNGKLFFK